MNRFNGTWELLAWKYNVNEETLYIQCPKQVTEPITDPRIHVFRKVALTPSAISMSRPEYILMDVIPFSEDKD